MIVLLVVRILRLGFDQLPVVVYAIQQEHIGLWRTARGLLSQGWYFYDIGLLVTGTLAARSLIRANPSARFYVMMWACIDVLYLLVSLCRRINEAFIGRAGSFSWPYLVRASAYLATDLALSVFLLVWFSRGKIKQQVEGWQTPCTGR